MADWSNDRASQFTAQMGADHSQATYNRSIGWNGLTWDQRGGGGISLRGGESITVMSVAITFGTLAGVTGLLAAETDRLLFAAFCFIVVFLGFAVLGYALQGLVLVLTGQVFSRDRSASEAAPEPAIVTMGPAEGAIAADRPAPAQALPAPARSMRRPPPVFAAIVCGTAIGALAGTAIAWLAGPDIAAWEGVVRFAPIGAIGGAIFGLLRRRARHRAVQPAA